MSQETTPQRRNPEEYMRDTKPREGERRTPPLREDELKKERPDQSPRMMFFSKEQPKQLDEDIGNSKENSTEKPDDGGKLGD